MGGLPSSAFLLVMAAHLGQAYVGGGVAAGLAASRRVEMAVLVGAITLLACLINLFLLPAPLWMWLEIPGCLVVSWAAGETVRRMIDRSMRGGAPP